MGEELREKDSMVDELINNLHKVCPEEARKIINELGLEEKELTKETQVVDERE